MCSNQNFLKLDKGGGDSGDFTRLIFYLKLLHFVHQILFGMYIASVMFTGMGKYRFNHQTRQHQTDQN